VILLQSEVLRLPLGALFRDGDGWAVFLAEDGRARLCRVEIGGRDSLSAGQRVALYPSDRIEDGVAITER
jgi:HlyD family secretion protein